LAFNDLAVEVAYSMDIGIGEHLTVADGVVKWNTGLVGWIFRQELL
jgi:hypothetical protein